jgi:hypothetical protein
MRRLAFSVLLSACGLSGNPQEDLETLTDNREVDCTSEPKCGTQIHCMTDALRDGRVAEYVETIPCGTGGPNHCVEHYFTYDGDIVQIEEWLADPGYGSMYESRCTGVSAVPATTSGCWAWSFSGCE